MRGLFYLTRLAPLLAAGLLLACEKMEPLVDLELDRPLVSDPLARVSVTTPWTDISNPEAGDNRYWTLSVTADPDGRVIDARVKDGPVEFRAEAVASVSAQTFGPNVHEGRPVRVRFPFVVGAYPAHYDGPADRAFPADPDLGHVVIRLRRTACLGWCPDYTVEVRGDGQVSYKGNASVLISGEHAWRVPQENVVALLDLFRRADYFKLEGYYEAAIPDLPTFITRLSIGDQHKFVLNYGGGASLDDHDALTFAIPAAVMEIEDAIDRLSGAESFASGNDETVARLKAEAWRFDSDAGANALAHLVAACRVDVAKAFLREGAPAPASKASSGGGPSIAEDAAACGDPDLIAALAPA